VGQARNDGIKNNFVYPKILHTFAIKINTNCSNMNTITTNGKSAMAFRFRNDLVGVIKDKAKKENRSVNNFLENLLVNYFNVDEKIPNDITLAAMEEAKRDDLETLDLENFQEWAKSL
jgi:hypothetical protein